MDEYEKAARELLGKQCPLIVFGWFASAFRWYHETYLQPAIDAAVKEALEKRDGEIQGGEMKEAKSVGRFGNALCTTRDKGNMSRSVQFCIFLALYISAVLLIMLVKTTVNAPADLMSVSLGDKACLLKSGEYAVWKLQDNSSVYAVRVIFWEETNAIKLATRDLHEVPIIQVEIDTVRGKQ